MGIPTKFEMREALARNAARKNKRFLETVKSNIERISERLLKGNSRKLDTDIGSPETAEAVLSAFRKKGYKVEIVWHDKKVAVKRGHNIVQRATFEFDFSEFEVESN